MRDYKEIINELRNIDFNDNSKTEDIVKLIYNLRFRHSLASGAGILKYEFSLKPNFLPQIEQLL